MAAKSAKTEIIVSDRYKVVRIDSMNWQIFEYRKIKESLNAEQSKRAGEYDWCAMPIYYGNLKYALLRLIDLDVATDGESMTLEQAVRHIRQVERNIVKAVEKASAQ